MSKFYFFILFILFITVIPGHTSFNPDRYLSELYHAEGESRASLGITFGKINLIQIGFCGEFRFLERVSVELLLQIYWRNVFRFDTPLLEYDTLGLGLRFKYYLAQQFFNGEPTPGWGIWAGLEYMGALTVAPPADAYSLSDSGSRGSLRLLLGDKISIGSEHGYLEILSGVGVYTGSSTGLSSGFFVPFDLVWGIMF